MVLAWFYEGIDRGNSVKQRTQILFMRHPETLGNMQLRFVGQTNSPLTDKGHEQKEEAIEALCAYKPELIISSPLERCLAIAEVVADSLNQELVVDQRAIEINFGRLEGLSYGEVKRLGLVFPWDEESEERKEEIGFESLRDVDRRVKSLCEEFANRYEKIAIVTHGGVIRSALSTYFSLSQQAHIMIENVSSHILEVQGKSFCLRAYGLYPHELSQRIKSGKLS